MKTAPLMLLAMMLVAWASPTASAVTPPLTEDFNTDVANWADNTGAALLDHVATGGYDGSGYATTQVSLQGLGGDTFVLFRGQDELDSSDNAFFGNWIADGVGEFSAYVRHDAPMPLNFFTRFSGPGNFPGATAIRFAPVLPNTWTLMEFEIEPTNPAFVTFEGTDFDSVFSNVGHLQIGVDVPAALDGVPTPFNFDIDGAGVLPVPEPTSLLLAVGGVIAAGLTYRRQLR